MLESKKNFGKKNLRKEKSVSKQIKPKIFKYFTNVFLLNNSNYDILTRIFINIIYLETFACIKH